MEGEPKALSMEEGTNGDFRSGVLAGHRPHDSAAFGFGEYVGHNIKAHCIKAKEQRRYRWNRNLTPGILILPKATLSVQPTPGISIE